MRWGECGECDDLREMNPHEVGFTIAGNWWNQPPFVAQQGFEALGEGLLTDRCMRFRIGVHMGDVIEKVDGTVYGDGVNIASRLEGLAKPGGILVSDTVHGAVRNQSAATF